jgi:hypothetical protein
VGARDQSGTLLSSIARMISGSEFEERLAALEAQANQEGGR